MQDSLNDDVVRPTKLSAMKKHLKSHWKKCIVWTIEIIFVFTCLYVSARAFVVVIGGLFSAYLVLSGRQLDYALRTPFWLPFGKGGSFFPAEHEVAFMTSESVQIYGWATVIAIVIVVVVAAVRFTVTHVNDLRENFRILQEKAERNAQYALDCEVSAAKAKAKVEAVAAEQCKVYRAFIHYLDISKKKMDMSAVEPGSTRVYFVFVTIGDGKLFPADDRRIHFFDIKGDLYPNAIGAPRYSNVVTKEKTLKVTMMGVEYILNTVPYSTVHATSIAE